jgi:hypothetical protein
MIDKTAFLFSRVLLLLLVLVVGRLTAEVLVASVIYVDAGVLEWGTRKAYLLLFCGPVLAVLCLVVSSTSFVLPLNGIGVGSFWSCFSWLLVS